MKYETKTKKLVQVSTYSRSAGCSSESQLNVPFSTETTESNNKI